MRSNKKQYFAFQDDHYFRVANEGSSHGFNTGVKHIRAGTPDPSLSVVTGSDRNSLNDIRVRVGLGHVGWTVVLLVILSENVVWK